MVDFRSRSEREKENQRNVAEQTDYQHMYNQVLVENQAFRAKLDEITSCHGELQAQFSDLLTQFEALKTSSHERSNDLLKMAQNMETMVATAYEQQGALMDRFRADLNQRLGEAKGGLSRLDDKP